MASSPHEADTSAEKPIVIAAADPVQRPAVEPSPAPAATTSPADADGAITRTVRAQLAGDNTLKDLQIDVNTAAGVVALRGTAPDQAAVDHARELASGVPNVQRVDTTALTVSGNAANSGHTGNAGTGNGAESDAAAPQPEAAAPQPEAGAPQP